MAAYASYRHIYQRYMLAFPHIMKIGILFLFCLVNAGRGNRRGTTAVGTVKMDL